MTLSGRFVLLLLAGLLPLVLIGRPWVLLAWLGLAAILASVDLILAGSPRRVEIERRLPQRIRLGEAAAATLLLRNLGRRTIVGAVRDGWDPSAGLQRNRHPMRIPAGERRALEQTLVPWRRGERRAHHVSVRSFGPLGLAARQATLLAPGAVRVLPPFHSRKHLPSRLARLRELDGRTSLMIRGQGSEFDSLREYVRGDDVRSIDWRATARRQDLMVRTWRPERDRRVVIVIDTGRTSAARVEDEPRLDTAFEATLLLAALASGAGDRVDVLAFDRRRRARVHAASRAELLSRTVEALAPVEAELLETDWAAVPAEVRTLTTQRALVVLLTSIDSVGAAEGLLAMLPQLTRTHNVLVASVADPELRAMTGDRGDRAAVYRAASAERSLADIARVSAAVRRLGGTVVTGTPQELPPALADRYIALKASGRL
ncbi:DUF58 domain-containing protein [Microbacteriaceae bacterium VKM Ac-2855]|nr:DUF58 domain-containing protein [Microbacteriaceae bacterium VKM Ac-2855]